MVCLHLRDFLVSGSLVPIFRWHSSCVFAQISPSIRCIHYFHHCYDNSKLRKEGPILLCVFKRDRVNMVASHDKGTDGDWTHRADRKQSQEQVVAWSQEAESRQEVGWVLKPPSLTTAPIHWGRFYLLKTPQLLQTAPPSGCQVFKHLSLRETFHIQSTTWGHLSEWMKGHSHDLILMWLSAETYCQLRSYAEVFGIRTLMLLGRQIEPISDIFSVASTAIWTPAVHTGYMGKTDVLFPFIRGNSSRTHWYEPFHVIWDGSSMRYILI